MDEQIPNTNLIRPLPACQILSVEHPCIIHNLQRGLASLGGQHQINQWLESSTDAGEKPIYASLRPEHAFAIAIPSKHVVTNSILLKLTLPKRTGRKRKRGSTDSYIRDVQRPDSGLVDAKTLHRSLQDNSTRYSSQAVGLIRDSYRFKAITALQCAKSPFMQYMEKTVLSSNFESMTSFKLSTDQALLRDQEIQFPPVLQFTDPPFPYSYRQNSAVRIETDKSGKDISYNAHVVSAIPTNVISLDDEALTGPPSTLPPETALDARTQRLIQQLRTELDKRPVLTTRVQLYLTKTVGYYNLRKALPYVGYLFRGGPFRDALIKFGVDPRTDSKYRIYQVHGVQIASNSTRSKKRFGLGEPKDKRNPKTHMFDGTEVYTEGRIYQVCDVTDPSVQRLMAGASVAESYEPTTCGWYKTGTWGLFRTLLKDKIDRLINETTKPSEYYDGIINQWTDEADDLPKEINTGGDGEAAALVSKARGNCRTVENTVKYANKDRRKAADTGPSEEELEVGGEFGDPGVSDRDEGLDDVEVSERDERSEFDDNFMETEAEV